MPTLLTDAGISEAYADELFIHRTIGGDAVSHFFHKYRDFSITGDQKQVCVGVK
jgi:hypothetical protein